jgi:hypothetical protein
MLDVFVPIISRSGMHAIPARRGIVVPGSCLRTIGHGRHPTAVERIASTQAGSLRHGEHVQPGLTQRDMWVMHSPLRRREASDDGVQRIFMPNLSHVLPVLTAV